MNLNEIVISNKMNILWVRIPKNCTSVMHVWLAINLELKKSMIEVIDHVEDNLIKAKNENQVKHEINDKTSILILRNPYSRFISAFCGKFIYRKGDMESSKLLKDLNLEAYPVDISFNDILNSMSNLDNLNNINTHWRPQYTFFNGIGLDKFTYVANKENFKYHLNKICNKEEFKNVDKKINSIPYSDIEINKNISDDKVIKFITEYRKVPKPKYFLNENTRNKIKELYKRDFELYEKAFNKTEEDLYKEVLNE